MREDGRTYAYTLPANTMRLANQEKKDELLATLKTRMADTTFYFSFRPVKWHTRIKNIFAKVAPYKELKKLLEKYGVTEAEALELLDVDEEIWSRICKGAFEPTKNLLYSFALTSHLSLEDASRLMGVCGYEFDYANVKDVVVSYLLGSKVYNRDMIDAALAEYKVANLFIK